MAMNKNMMVSHNNSRSDSMTMEETLALLGRMKYLNRVQNDKYNPIKLMKKLGVTWGDIKEVEC